MKYFYDTEFVEDGVTIDLVSIGIVAEDGREYYAVSSEFNLEKFRARPWMMENVWPSLPVTAYGTSTGKSDQAFNYGHPSVRSRETISREVYRFLMDDPHGTLPELWAWYGAYDHVALCQLYGKMIDLPAGIPMWTNDLRQEVHRLDCMDTLPEQAAGKHNALEDARHLRDNYYVVHPVTIGLMSKKS
jgi:hypothetical protein